MAITDKKIGSWTNPVVNEADQPQRTAAEMKAIFDANSNQIKAAFNAVIDELVGTGERATLETGHSERFRRNGRSPACGAAEHVRELPKLIGHKGDPAERGQQDRGHAGRRNMAADSADRRSGNGFGRPSRCGRHSGYGRIPDVRRIRNGKQTNAVEQDQKCARKRIRGSRAHAHAFKYRSGLV